MSHFFKSFLSFLFFLSTLLGHGQCSPKILSSPTVTNWGEWHNWESCPNGSYVVGMQLKTESYLGYEPDDSALNGIQFFCAEIGSQEQKAVITSGVGEWGTFGQEYLCNKGVATAFQLRSEKDQGKADDTAANNLRLHCNRQEEWMEGDGLSFGDWTAKQSCSEKQAICGIQTQVEAKHANDESALNNVNVQCCDIPDPAQICAPMDEWELLLECDNTDASSPTTCTIAQKIGVSHSSSESAGHHEELETYLDVGFSLKGALGFLKFNFGVNLGLSTVTGNDWSMTNSEVWNLETTITYSFEVPAGHKAQLLQPAGTCGIYNVMASKVKRIDTRKGSLKQSVTYFDAYSM